MKAPPELRQATRSPRCQGRSPDPLRGRSVSLPFTRSPAAAIMSLRKIHRSSEEELGLVKAHRLLGSAIGGADDRLHWALMPGAGGGRRGIAHGSHAHGGATRHPARGGRGTGTAVLDSSTFASIGPDGAFTFVPPMVFMGPGRSRPRCRMARFRGEWRGARRSSASAGWPDAPVPARAAKPATSARPRPIRSARGRGRSPVPGEQLQEGRGALSPGRAA